MKLSFRWFGKDDKIPLQYIRQIPGMAGIVTALHHIPVGEVWPREEIRELKKTVEKHGLELAVIESVPVHEDIKLGLPTRERYIENYKQTLRHLGKENIGIVCYNFMPLLDWTRTSLQYGLPDGSHTLAFDEQAAQRLNPLKHDFDLPAWDLSYDKTEMTRLLELYKGITEEDLWNHLAHFLREIIPVAEEAGVRMAIHPDDPPWPIFGVPRIITGRDSLERLLQIVDSPHNGLTFCTGSLGSRPDNDIPGMIRSFGKRGRIHFAHVRNIKYTGDRSFYESSHLSRDGELDIVEIMRAFRDSGFNGPLRPDHGRMIWGETGRPGYGLYDRALGAAYLNGIWEALDAHAPGLSFL